MGIRTLMHATSNSSATGGLTWFGALSAAGCVAAPLTTAAIGARDALVVPEEAVRRLQLGGTEAGFVCRGMMRVSSSRFSIV